MSVGEIMERASRDLSGANDGSEGGAEKDKDIDSHSDESEDVELLSESVGTVTVPQTSPQETRDTNGGGNRKKILGRYFTDRGYLDKMSRQERRRIEGEIIKGHKPGESVTVTFQSCNAPVLIVCPTTPPPVWGEVGKHRGIYLI